jgi:DNA-directed RNA polymerase subunit delta
MATTLCSECDEEITITGRIRLGAKLICEHCGARLEVVSTMPLEVDLLQEDEDDDLWDDDELAEDLGDEEDEEDEEVLAGYGAVYDDFDEEELDDVFEEDLDDLEEEDLEEEDLESFDDDRWS